MNQGGHHTSCAGPWPTELHSFPRWMLFFFFPSVTCSFSSLHTHHVFLSVKKRMTIIRLISLALVYSLLSTSTTSQLSLTDLTNEHSALSLWFEWRTFFWHPRVVRKSLPLKSAVFREGEIQRLNSYSSIEKIKGWPAGSWTPWGPTWFKDPGSL